MRPSSMNPTPPFFHLFLRHPLPRSRTERRHFGCLAAKLSTAIAATVCIDDSLIAPLTGFGAFCLSYVLFHSKLPASTMLGVFRNERMKDSASFFICLGPSMMLRPSLWLFGCAQMCSFKSGE
ncbi:hypothetical protein ebA2387 [Aromatoleum aromaticum EbN1]|uniref:Uncharacterized protein n=1 Tax=Aromatoleum aromaticum (strain DSM 19018 / LMG 30748 / EbN1) TaxID=76114 RepID=Q5P5F8_AROAE|nr:hypothetical protein ebA2387 [Aromatoleum aromaticum EbN1]